MTEKLMQIHLCCYVECVPMLLLKTKEFLKNPLFKKGSMQNN